MSTVLGLELIYNKLKRLFIGIKFLFIRSTVFGLELIYNQIKRLFIGIKFFFIRIRYVLAPRQQVELCDEFQARDFVLILMTILMSTISMKRSS